VETGPLLIVLLSAAGHAMWNFFAKGSRNKLVFIWALYALGGVFYLPLYLWRGLGADLSGCVWACVVASAAVKAIYVVLIAEALTAGDLSLAYPLSRIAPAIVPFWAALVLGERVTALGGVGIAIVCVAILVIHLEGLSAAHVRRLARALLTRGTGFALLTALAVSVYSVVDKLAMSRCSEPIAFNYLHWVISVAMLTPYVLWRCGRRAIVAVCRIEWLPLTLSGFLDFGAYTLILFVMQSSKVSYIVAARQVSQIVAITLGTVVLRERCGAIRLLAGALIVIGITLIGAAR